VLVLLPRRAESSQNSGFFVVLLTFPQPERKSRPRPTGGQTPDSVRQVETEFPEPIVDALRNGREAALLLRNHVKTFFELLKKSDSDSGVQRAFRKDLEGAKDVQQAFSRHRASPFPASPVRPFYQGAHGIGGDYDDFSFCLAAVGGSRSVRYRVKELAPLC